MIKWGLRAGSIEREKLSCSLMLFRGLKMCVDDIDLEVKVVLSVLYFACLLMFFVEREQNNVIKQSRSRPYIT
jgi:hypothetical protein